MMLLVCFDLPRTTKFERKQANKYQKKLIELGFTRKQFSLYEREIKQKNTREKVIEVLRTELPSTGMITLYLLPNDGFTSIFWTHFSRVFFRNESTLENVIISA